MSAYFPRRRYRFSVGVLETLRWFVCAAKQRAAQNDHAEIEKAADDLLQRLDDKRS